MVLEGMIDWVSEFFQGMVNAVPEGYRILAVLFLYTLFIALYSVFIWKFYKFLACKEIIQLNLSQYNYSKHPFLEKFFAGVLYTIEYLIILPFLVLFWFAILSMFLLLLSESKDAQQILLIAAAIIASTRIASYISEDLSKDIAKILPFTVLAMFLLNVDFLDIEGFFEKVSQIPALFNHVLMFIVFIFGIEFILRMVYLSAQFFISEEERVEEEK